MAAIFKYTGLPEAEVNTIAGKFKDLTKMRYEKKGFVFMFEKETDPNSTIIGYIKTVDNEEDYGYIYHCLVNKREDDKLDLTVRIPYHLARVIKKTPPLKISGDRKEAMKFVGELRDYQKIDCPKILEEMESRGSSFFVAFPGYGKTVVTCYITSQVASKTLVLVPGVGLAKQCMSEFALHLPNAKFYVMETDRKIPEDADVVIAYIDRLHGAVGLFDDFEFVIIDESHKHTTPKRVASLLGLKPRRMLALTATPGEKRTTTELFVGPNTIKPTRIKKWFITFPEIHCGLVGKSYNSGVEGYNNAINALVESPSYTGKILTYVKYFSAQGRRIMIITMRDSMRDYLTKAISEINGLTVAALTKDDKTCGNVNVVIGNYQITGTGFDLKSAVKEFDGQHIDVTIFAGSIKDTTLMIQMAGRSFRSETALAIFPAVRDVDTFYKHEMKLRETAKQTLGCKILEEYGAFLSQLEIKNIK